MEQAGEMPEKFEQPFGGIMLGSIRSPLSGARHLATLTALSASSLFSQSFQVNIHIDPNADTAQISPLIYGSNGQSNDRPFNITARRLGGNRLTGYNWENNASNMGMDYNQSNANDDYLTWSANIPAGQENIPGIVLTAFHDTSLAMGCYSLLTLPAAGYVSRDKAGPVLLAETAPSPRWREVRNFKGSAFTTNPDTTDPYVYVDEEVNFLVSRYGQASGAQGVRGYEVDNEPALWPSTHPRIHPDSTHCAELVSKTMALARAVKSVDPSAEVFGGVCYGFNEIYDLQSAPDWGIYSHYKSWVSALLALARDSSEQFGSRLMDVLDVHWYPDLNHPVTSDATDSATAAARVYAPRSLWDSTYVEDGWIGQWFRPVSLIPNLKTAVALNYPGTKLSISEFDYGAPQHITGGIAIADVLGIFGKYGLYFATHWGALDSYVGTAYALYRNYDGAGSCFGSLSVLATTSDINNTSVYASRSSGSDLHVILINKNFSRPASISLSIAGGAQYLSAMDYGFSSVGPSVVAAGSIPLSGNVLPYTLPPLSAHHLILKTTPASVRPGGTPTEGFRLEQNYPNPFNPSTIIRYFLPQKSAVHLDVYNVLGELVVRLADGVQEPGTHEVVFKADRLSSGNYICRLTSGGLVASHLMSVIK